MRKSSIAKHYLLRERAGLAEAIGAELRYRRRCIGLTQRELGAPFTAAYISAVELGYAVPSIPTLILLTQRLEIGVEEFFRGVNARWTAVYNPGHEHQDSSPGRRR